MGLGALYMEYDVRVQKKIIKSRFNLMPVGIFLNFVYCLYITTYCDLHNIDYLGLPLFLEFVLYTSSILLFHYFYSNYEDFVWHSWKWIGNASLILPFIAIGEYKIIPLIFSSGWMVNDIYWAVRNNKEWWYTGDGKGDLMDIIFKGNHLISWIVKIIFFICTIFGFIVLKNYIY